MLIWHIEFVTDIQLSGVVVETDTPLKPVLVDILFNGVLFRTERVCLQCDYRELRKLDPSLFPALRERLNGVTLVACRFEYVVPPYVPNSQSVEVLVLEHKSKQVLFREYRNFTENYKIAVTSACGRVLMGRLVAHSVLNSRLIFGGQFGYLGELRHLIARSSSGDEVSCKVLDAADLSETPYFAGFPDKRWVRVEGEMAISSHPDRIVLADSSQSLVVPISSGLAIPSEFLQQLHEWSYPSNAQMKRVMGYANRLHYYQTGYETYRMLDDALADFAGRRMSDFSTVVDWGCGCGRLTQHLIARTPATVFGLDIDRENVAWCRENLRPAQFEVVGLAPPTQLPKARADLVIGISVFTHLHEEAQDQWLDEIRRLLRPDGIALLTIRSLHSFCTGAISTARYHNFITRGIDDAPIGHTLDDILKSDEFPYYRETSHSYEYISKRWGAYFDIVGINAGAHLNYQDLVIARKRTGGGETAPVSKY